ncbi:MAG: phosphate ABC transporter ATP-binding protein [Candidatus Omnitrophica bacterium]|nr:phosphate ABC transporter ATP-binding protein [Candidatus Omnitrophota bacterium]
MVDSCIKITIVDLSASYGAVCALKSLSLDVREGEILSVIGPSNSGKTTFLRCLNRFNDTNPHFSHRGMVTINGIDIYGNIDVEMLRKKVGMVFALPTVLPMSVWENAAYGLRRHGIRDERMIALSVENSLRAAYLWDEVKDRLEAAALNLSGGQQQRLCLARTLAVEPDIILYDEPCSGLDPISTAKIEEAMIHFKDKYTQILVTNNTKQAARVGNRTAFFLMGQMVELDATNKIFTSPSDQRTEDYISGRFG